MDPNLKQLARPIQDAILRATSHGPKFGPGWTVCIRNHQGEVVLAEFKVGSHEQVSRLTMELAEHGLFLTVEDLANCDFVFEDDATQASNGKSTH